MTTTLVVLLMVMDVVMLMAVIYLSKRKIDASDLIVELTDERKYLTELRASIQEDLDNAATKGQELVKRMALIATEAEQEVKEGSITLSKELEALVNKLSSNFENPLKELTKRQGALESILRRVEQEKGLLLKATERAEKLSQFFNKQVPYEDILKEIQDKKYHDARELISKGLSHDTIAREIGLSLSEVQLLVGLGS